VILMSLYPDPGKIRTILGLVLWTAVLMSWGIATPESRLDSLRRSISSEVKPDQAMEYMRQVYETDRWFTFPKFQETAEYLARTMKEIGLQEVQLLGAPADGVSQFGYWTMPLAWDVRQARLELVGQGVPEEFRVLADYEKVPSLGMWSGPTPPGGVTADLVELKDTSRAAVERLELKGKMVLIHENPAGIKWLLAKKGVLGAINTSTENPALENGRQCAYVSYISKRGEPTPRDLGERLQNIFKERIKTRFLKPI
jgi:hypothetical protein